MEVYFQDYRSLRPKGSYKRGQRAGTCGGRYIGSECRILRTRRERKGLVRSTGIGIGQLQAGDCCRAVRIMNQAELVREDDRCLMVPDNIRPIAAIRADRKPRRTVIAWCRLESCFRCAEADWETIASQHRKY